MSGKEKGIKKEKVNWFLQLITLGDRFSWRDFYDRLKKGIVDFSIVFFGVLLSFGVEQKGMRDDERDDGIENLYKLRDEIEEMIEYTEVYAEELDWVVAMFTKQFLKWEKDNDSVFIDWWDDPEDKEYGGFHFAPMAQYVQRNPFSPPRTTFEAIKLDGTFRLLPDIVGRRMTDAYDGQDINYLIENTGKNGIEHRYVNQFIDRVASKWVYDLPPFDLNDNRFWIKNRKYIQSDKFIRYNLFKRVEMWELEVKVQVDYYKEFLEGSYRMLDSVIAAREREYKIIYWVLNPQT